jgi:hypothetical protein
LASLLGGHEGIEGDQEKSDSSQIEWSIRYIYPLSRVHRCWGGGRVSSPPFRPISHHSQMYYFEEEIKRSKGILLKRQYSQNALTAFRNKFYRIAPFVLTYSPYGMKRRREDMRNSFPTTLLHKSSSSKFYTSSFEDTTGHHLSSPFRKNILIIPFHMKKFVQIFCLKASFNK